MIYVLILICIALFWIGGILRNLNDNICRMYLENKDKLK